MIGSMGRITKSRVGPGFGLALLLAGAAWAQGSPAPKRPQNPQANPMNGPWWRTPLAGRLGLDADQRKKLDDLWQQHRLRRIDLEAVLQKAQVTLEPMLQADSPDEDKIMAQIDRVTQAEGEVRKGEIRWQLNMRQILSLDQWRRLQEQVRSGPGNSQQPGPQPGPNNPPPLGQPRPPQRPQQ